MAAMTELKMLDINVRGIQDKGSYAKFIHVAETWMVNERIGVICAQEHNLHPDRKAELERLASLRNMTLIICFGEKRQDGTHWGGALILVSDKTLSVSTVENLNITWLM